MRIGRMLSFRVIRGELFDAITPLGTGTAHSSPL